MARKSPRRSRDSAAALALVRKSAGKRDPTAAKSSTKAPEGKRVTYPSIRIVPCRTRAHALRGPKLLAAGHVKAGKLLLKVFYLGKVEHGDVPIFRVLGGKILVVVFGAIKSFQRNDLGHDRIRENFGLIELTHVGLSDSLLLLVRKKDYRAILSTRVGSLAIQFRRVMRHGEKYFQQLAQSNLRGVVNDFNGLRMSG